MRPVADPSGSVIERKGVTAVGEFHVAVVEGEYSVFEPELLIVALASPKLVDVFLECLSRAALV